MAEKQEKQTIYQALVAAQSKIQAAGKSGENTYDHYSYAMLQDYCNAIREPMKENGLALSVSIDDILDLADRTTSQGKVEHAVRVKLKGILIHSSGETLEYFGWGEGQDRADKAIYKAITGGKKYLIADIFNVPTTDDPETDSHEDFDKKGSQKPVEAPKAQAAKQGNKATPATANRGNRAAAGNLMPINDEEQIKRGCINSPQIEELKATVKGKGINPKDFMIWMWIYTESLGQKAIQLKDISTSFYKEMYDTVVHDSGEIKSCADRWREKQDKEAAESKADDGVK